MNAAGPSAEPLPCSGCGKFIDPLRAGHVAIFDQRFHFFCDRISCRAAFLGRHGAEPETKDATEAFRSQMLAAAASDGRISPAPKRRPDDDARISPAFGPIGEPELPDTPFLDDDPALVEPIAQTILNDEGVRHEPGDPRDVGALLLVMAVVAGALAVCLALAGDARLVIAARIVLALVGASMLLGRAATTPRDAVDPHPLALLASAFAALAVAVVAALGKDAGAAAEATSLAGIIVTAQALSIALAESARRPTSLEREWIGEALSVPGHRIDRWRDGSASRSADGERDPARTAVFDLHPGEQLLVEEGEIVPVDLTVAGADVDVLPWIGATTAVRRREGDSIVAGARVVRGKLRGICTWSGPDRAYARVLLDARRRADARAPIALASRHLVERWAVGAAIGGAVSATLARRAPVDIAMVAIAVHAALATAVIATISAAHVARGIVLGLRRGIVYKSADAWDRAGKVLVATFCARGTLLLGEPELAELEAASPKLSPKDVLALAAGAERAEEHPIATAIVRAARTRGVRPDGVRNPNLSPGLGVIAVSSSGEELCVGSRSLLLDQRISIAAAEQRISELEALGRTVILISLGGRFAGLLALQDGLRPGARAAVQHLLDARIEPVLISGDARETCEAIGRSLDIEHIRPEVLPSERGAEVRRILEAGASVAVLGHAGIDDSALAAGDVAVALGAAGSTPGDFAVSLASDDVRDAALALALAHRARSEARVGLGLAVVPALVGCIAIAFGILPPAYAPIASLVGCAVAVAHIRRN